MMQAELSLAVHLHLDGKKTTCSVAVLNIEICRRGQEQRGLTERDAMNPSRSLVLARFLESNVESSCQSCRSPLFLSWMRTGLASAGGGVGGAVASPTSTLAVFSCLLDPFCGDIKLFPNLLFHILVIRPVLQDSKGGYSVFLFWPRSQLKPICLRSSAFTSVSWN